jgi:hypothetical protein
MNFFLRTETACARLHSDADGHLYRLECLECLDSNTLDATAHGNREVLHSRFNVVQGQEQLGAVPVQDDAVIAQQWRSCGVA